ncbi:MAG: hypothetical protein GY832_41180 [Chloroflexi bacterium]|nr:hypothetical protein [Chloroflexota bacterium]
MRENIGFKCGLCAMLVVSVACVMLGLLCFPALTNAAPGLLLPPRNTSTPLPTPTQPVQLTPTSQPTSPPKPAPAGAKIELRVQFPADWPWDELYWQDLWTVVQWQDEKGNWHDVDGWQGNPIAYSTGEAIVMWWLPDELLGQGPFRWVVYQSQAGQWLTISAVFHLPSLVNQVEEVRVSIKY